MGLAASGSEDFGDSHGNWRLSGSRAASLCICPDCSFLVVQEPTSTRQCPQGIPRYSELWERALHHPLSSLLPFLSWESMDNNPVRNLSHTR